MRDQKAHLLISCALIACALLTQGCPPESIARLEDYFPLDRDEEKGQGNQWDFRVYEVIHPDCNDCDPAVEGEDPCWGFERLDAVVRWEVDEIIDQQSPRWKGVPAWRIKETITVEAEKADFTEYFYFVSLGEGTDSAVLYSLSADHYEEKLSADDLQRYDRLHRTNVAPPNDPNDVNDAPDFVRWERQDMPVVESGVDGAYERLSDLWWRFARGKARTLFEPRDDTKSAKADDGNQPPPINDWRGVPLDKLNEFFDQELLAIEVLDAFDNPIHVRDVKLGDALFESSGGFLFDGLRSDYSFRGDFDYEAWNLFRKGVGPLIFQVDISKLAELEAQSSGKDIPLVDCRERLGFYALVRVRLPGVFPELSFTYEGAPHLGGTLPTDRQVPREVQFIDNTVDLQEAPIIIRYWEFGDDTAGFDQEPGTDPPRHSYADVRAIPDEVLSLVPGLFVPTFSAVSVTGDDTISLALGDYLKVEDGYIVAYEDYDMSTMGGITQGYIEVTEPPEAKFEVVNRVDPSDRVARLVQFKDVSDPKNEMPEDQRRYAISMYRHPIETWEWDFGFEGDQGRLTITREVVEVKDSDEPTLTYHWDWGADGIPDESLSFPVDTRQDPEVSYPGTGCYTVSLRVESAVDEDTETKERLVEVVDPPEADFRIADTTPPDRLFPRTVVFENLSTTDEEATFCDLHSLTYEWDFGDPASGDDNSSTERNPEHTYDAPGCYTVTLTVRNDIDEDTEVKQGYVEVVAAPMADFSIPPTTPPQRVAPRTVPFTNLSTTTAGATYCDAHDLTYNWDFGDGGTSQERNPTYVYQGSGCFTVSLTVTNDIGQAVETKQAYVEVVDPPMADFSIPDTTPPQRLVPRTVTFTNLSTTNAGATYCDAHDLTYNWDFGDGGTSQERNPTYMYQGSGCFTVSLTVTNDIGQAIETKQGYVEVVDPPAADFSIPDMTPAERLFPRTVTFTNLSTTNADAEECDQHDVTYEWDFDGDGVVDETQDGTETQATYTYDDPVEESGEMSGCYTVTLTVTNDIGQDTETKVDYVEVTELPTADFAPDVTVGFAPLGVTFENLSVANNMYACEEYPITLWEWDFDNDGEVDLSTNDPEEPVEHTYEESGCYTVSLTVTSAPGSHTETKGQLIEVWGSPVAAFSVPDTTPPERLAPRTVTFTNLSTTDEDATFCTTYPVTNEWDFDGDGDVDSTDASPTCVYQTSGCYTVTLTVTNDLGTDTASTQVEVVDPPEADFSIPDTTPLQRLAPRTVVFSNLSTTTAGATYCDAHDVTYAWEFGDGGTSAAQNPTYLYQDAGCYTVTLTVTNDIGQAIETKQGYVEVVGPPEADFSIPDTMPPQRVAPRTVVFANLSTTNAGAMYCDPHDVTYEWDFGDGGTSAAQNPTYVYQDAGCYTVTLTVTNDIGQAVETKQGYVEVVDQPEAGFSIPDATPPERVAPREVTFTNLSTTTAGATYCDAHDVTYAWEFGDGGTSAAQNPTYVYQDAGCYTVTLTVTNDIGQAVETMEVEVTEPPTAALSGAPRTGLAPLTVLFEDASLANNGDVCDEDYPITEWFWDFGDPESGDNNTSSLQIPPAHTYSDPGCYTVSLTVTSGVGSDMVTMTDFIDVAELPTAAFSVDVTTGPAPLTVTFQDESMANDEDTCVAHPIGWLWSFGDGEGSDEPSPGHTYENTGTFTVSLTVFSDLGQDTETKDDYIEVNTGTLTAAP